MKFKSISIITIASLAVLMLSCKTKSPNQNETLDKPDPTQPQAMPMELDQSKFDKDLPDACTLMSPEFLAGLLKMDTGAFTVKDGSSNINNKARSCFYKWQGNLPNAGIMIQVMKNPVADEFPTYFVEYIKGKKKDGKQGLGGDGKVYIYSYLPGFGDDGAYSTEAGKYTWRVGNDLGFNIAFNSTLSPEEQKSVAESIANEMMKNYAK